MQNAECRIVLTNFCTGSNLRCCVKNKKGSADKYSYRAVRKSTANRGVQYTGKYEQGGYTEVYTEVYDKRVHGRGSLHLLTAVGSTPRLHVDPGFLTKSPIYIDRSANHRVPPMTR